MAPPLAATFEEAGEVGIGGGALEVVEAGGALAGEKRTRYIGGGWPCRCD
jgi:hypothetical protein